MINRKDVYNKYNGRCGYCGSEINIKDMQVDHIIPKRNYLSHIKSKFNIPPFLSHLTEHDMDHIDNLMPSCRVCNNWKKTFHLELFRSEIKEQIKRLHDYSANYRLAKKYGLVEETNKDIIFYFEEE